MRGSRWICGARHSSSRGTHMAGPHKRDARAEFAEQMNIGSRHAAVQDVAEDRDVQPFEAAAAVANRQRIEQRLRGMLVRAVAGVDHRNIQAARDEIRGARRCMTHHDAVGLHGVERADRVEQRFAFFQAGGFRLQIHRVGAEARGRRGEADARASGRLEESERHGLAAQRGQFFQGMALEFLKWLRLIEHENNLLGAERFDAEQMAQALRHGIE